MRGRTWLLSKAVRVAGACGPALVVGTSACAAPQAASPRGSGAVTKAAEEGAGTDRPKTPPPAAGVPAAGVPAPAPPTTAVAPLAADDGAVAVINGERVPRTRYDRAHARALQPHRGADGEVPAEIRARISASVLGQIVEDTLLAQKARALGVTVPTTAVERGLEERKRRFPDAEAFQRFLEQSFRNEEEVRQEVERELLRRALFEKLAVVDSEAGPATGDARSPQELIAALRAHAVIEVLEPGVSLPKPPPPRRPVR